MAPINVLLKGIPAAPTLCLRVGDTNNPLDQPSLTAAVTAATGLPSPSFYLRSAGALLCADSLVTHVGQHTLFVEVFLRRALPGGKGGFGATLKGSSATKVTTNFDACRDLHGRRLRDVRDHAAITEYLRTHGLPSNQKRPPKKRTRNPEPPDDDVVTTVDTGKLDETIDAVNRDVEDAVAAGLRVAADQRKRSRVEHLKRSRADAVMTGLVGDFDGLSSDSENSETEVLLSHRKGISPRHKQS